MTARAAAGEGAIAVVGAACRLPGAPDLAGFATLLAEGRDAVTEVPADRFTQACFLHPRAGEAGRALHFRAGTVGDVLAFDAAGFGISPREAVEMDPQQRLLLTLGRLALEDAGWPEAAVAGQPIGSYVGASTTDWGNLRQQDPASADRYMMTGSALSILANRLTNAFDLRGPAMTVDTACSSGLVALHEACEALRHGRIPAALVGGVNLLLSPYPFGGFFRAGMLGASGRCQAFGAGADGYVRAEGGVVLVLKPLAAALAAGDAIRGVIRGTGVNSAGRTNGIALPDGDAQAALIRAVLRAGRVTPDALGYFEAHGTGTPAGDPIEAGAIHRGVGRRRRPLPIGSAKSNIGHTEAAAGLVGVLKALVVLETGRIPATLHAEQPNPEIPFAEWGLVPVTRTRRLAAPHVAVNSFGFGGTNGCAVLGPAPRHRAPVSGRALATPPLLLSARSEDSLAALEAAWQDLPADSALCRGQAHRRDLLPHRAVIRGATITRGQASPGAGVAFVFAGNGAPWPGMGAQEMRHSAPFRAAVEAADGALRPHLGWSVAHALRRGARAADLARTDRAQPLLYAVQRGIVAALAAEGIVPALVLGHSVGEVAAAEAAGLLSLAQAARLIAARSVYQHTTRGTGQMAALGTSMAEAEAALAECGPGLEIAAVNAPDALTIAGPGDALARLGEVAATRRWSFVPLALDYAFHSAAMDPVRPGLMAALRGLRGHAPVLPMISTVTGQALTACPPGYWWQNLRAPVRFDQALATAMHHSPALFLEIGPHPVLQGYLRANLRAAAREAAVGATLRRPAMEGPTADPFPTVADRATVLGADPRGGPAFRGPLAWRGLPPQPATAVPYPCPATVESLRATESPQDGRLLGFRRNDGPGDEWRRSLDLLEEPWLADHAIGAQEGSPQALLPAAVMVELALEAALHRHPAAPVIELQDFTIRQPLVLAVDSPRELRCRLDAGGGFTLHSRRRLSAEEWTLHAEGRAAALVTLPAVPAEIPGDGEWQPGTCLTEASARLGLAYGPAFRPVRRWRTMQGCVEMELHTPDAAPPDAGLVLHPVRLDGAMQGLIGLLAGEKAAAEAAWLPVRLARICVRPGAALPVTARMQLAGPPGQRSTLAQGAMHDALGQPVAVIEGLELRRVPRLAPPGLGFHTEWVPAALPAAWPCAAPTFAIEAVATPGTGEPLEEAALLLQAHAAAVACEAGLTPGMPGALAAALRAHLPALDAASLPPAETIWQQVLAEQPDLAQELACLAAAAEALPLALAGLKVPVVTLSPQAESLRRLAMALGGATAQLLRGWPAGRPCRVLLVGAEDGPLLPALREAFALLGAGLRLTLAPLPGARLPPLPDGATLAPWDPLSDEAPPMEADLVLGLGLSPRRAAGHRLLEALQAATAPGGALLLAEPMPGPFWDMTAGLDAAWWEAPHLRDALCWEALLTSWARHRLLPLPPLPWPAALVLARKAEGAQLLTAAPARRFGIWAAPDQLPLAEALAEALAASGAGVTMLAAEPAPKALRGLSLVVLPGAGCAEAESGTRAARPSLAGCAGLAQIATLAEGLAEALHVVAVGETPAAAGLLALGRVLANEMPGLSPRRHGLDAGLSPSMAGKLLAASLLAPPDAEAEQHLTAGGRWVPRLRPVLPAPLPTGPLRLGVAQPGQLGTLGWQTAPPFPDPLPPGAVRLRVAAAGLNFRDVMWAQGLLPEETLAPGFAGPGLGMEVAGTIEAVGAGVALRPGQRVFGVAPSGLATQAITAAAALAPLPPGLSMTEAAALPVAFLTAVHSLEELARVAEGERVLIHGGAGAVGLAALQVALAAGARVAVTAGSEARRAFLRAAGAEIALDSRDLAFADALRAHWPAAPGEGCVDVCLNSLSGEAMERSLGLMAPFGRFLELGKRDYAEATRVGLRPLRRNVTYLAVDVDEMARARPALAARQLADIAQRLGEGALRPLPVQVHAASEVETAFRRLQGGGHIGKLVVLPPPEAAAHPAAAWCPQGTLLVVGGAGGFGLEAACWFAGQGVRHLALLSRRGGAAPGAEAAAARLRALGAEVRFIATDATDRGALANALDEIRRTMPPLDGVAQAAAIFSDGLAARLDAAAFQAAWEAKVTVAEHLDGLTAQDPLRLFLLFSSATVPIGAPGLGAYVAANAGLEAVARRRHAAGRPALAVQWGPIGDAGALAADAGAALSHRLGVTALPAAQALAALPALLEAGLPVAGLARMEWRAGRSSLAVLAEASFAALVGTEASDTGEDSAELRRALAQADPEAALEMLRRQIGQEVGRILRLPGESVPSHLPLPQLGLDSLGGMELRTGLERRFAVSVPLRAVNDALTVDALARQLLQGLAGDAGTGLPMETPGEEAAE